MNPDQVRRAVSIEPEWSARARALWLELVDLAVFGDLRASRLGAMGRLRKRLLEVGEKLRSLGNDRGWIPHPREQLKNALGSALSLKESLGLLQASAAEADGGTGRERFQLRLAELQRLVEELEPRQNAWAALLDSQYRCSED